MSEAPAYWRRIDLTDQLRLIWLQAGIDGWPKWVMSSIYEAALLLDFRKGTGKCGETLTQSLLLDTWDQSCNAYRGLPDRSE